MRLTNNEYALFLQEIKRELLQGRTQAIRTVNTEMINRYWQIGKKIVEKQKIYGWGKSIVERLAGDLQKDFPGTQGYSARNLWDMRRFYEQYAPFPNLQQLVAEIPWGHNLLILNKIDGVEEAKYYLKETAKYGWSRNVLLNAIKADVYRASLPESKQHNFTKTLPEHLAEQASEAIKSSYNLEFLGLEKAVKERELENRMITHIRDLLLTLGYGFAYLGHQYKIKLGQNEYFLDLLFYHRSLQCLIAVELKTGRFEPEHAAKLNFYLEILDEQVKLPNENPSIGILLCAEKDNLEVEYALRVINKPIGVAEYNLTRYLPKELQNRLPNADDLKELLNRSAA